MICLNCKHENPNDAKFCSNCGTSLVIECPNCRQQNPPGSRFCNNCGHKLGDAGQPTTDSGEPISKSDLQSLIPEGFAAKLQSARASQAMVGERRIVTMLFCDVTGSTAAAQKLDPEEWAEVMNQVFEHMIVPVSKYEGTVARLMGDAILAFFGAPVAHEDDPQRAILAGLDIAAAIQSFKENVTRHWELDIDVRVGINTGLVMVGQVGTDLQMEYTAMGDAINVAARMEQTAEPGTVQISQETYEHVAPLFDFEDLGQVAIKGKEDPIHTYRPLRRKHKPGRLRGIEGLVSPMIGRSAELETLVNALKKLETGASGIVCLIGEAGLGKSRLIREAAATVGGQNINEQSPVAWHETAALSYESARPYALFQRLLRHLWGIAPSDQAHVIREKIARDRTEDAGEQEIFQILLGAEVGQGAAGREGETYKRDLYRAIENLAVEESAKKPVVLVFDDLHWADPASVALVIHLMKMTDRLPMLLLCSMRPDRDAPGWQVKQAAENSYPHRFDEVTLNALTVDDTNTLVDNLLDVCDMPPEPRQRILEKTDGNPFFVEEVVRTLIDRELIVRETNGNETRWKAVQEIDAADIPGNLQSLLIARIDRLDKAARRTLQLASVIGRSFYFRVLEAIQGSTLPAVIDLDSELITLQRKELIRQAAYLPEPEYIFRHALAQEAAYSTILLRQRQLFHRLTGKAIEEIFAERLDEFYAILAYHFSRAEDPRVIRYATLAGDAAYRLFAIPEALSHYTLAIEAIRSHSHDQGWEGDDGSLPEGLTHLYERRGRCLELQSEYKDAQENFSEMEAVAREQGDRAMLLAALQARATNYAIPSPARDPEKGQALAEEAQELAEAMNDQEAKAKTLWIFMLLKMYAGSMPEGIPFGEQSVTLARRLGIQGQLALSLQDLARCYMSVGRLEKAYAVLSEARPLWKAVNNLPMLAENRGIIAQIRVMTADFDEVLEASDESLHIATAIENAWGRVSARSFIGLAYIAQGEIGRAQDVIQGLITDGEKAKHPARVLGWFYLAWLYSQLGAHERASHSADRGIESSAELPPIRPLSLAMAAKQLIQGEDLETAGEMLAEAGQSGSRKTLLIIDLVVDLVTAEYHLARHDYGQAQDYLDILLHKLHDSGVRYFLPEALRLQSRLLNEMGRADEARASLEEARETAETFGGRIMLWQILAELGEMEAAENIVELIAGTISDTELRQSYLAYADLKIEGHTSTD